MRFYNLLKALLDELVVVEVVSVSTSSVFVFLVDLLVVDDTAADDEASSTDSSSGLDLVFLVDVLVLGFLDEAGAGVEKTSSCFSGGTSFLELRVPSFLELLADVEESSLTPLTGVLRALLSSNISNFPIDLRFLIGFTFSSKSL